MSSNTNTTDVRNCDQCGKANAKSQCSRCKKAYYCGKECQKLAWKDHKKTCNKTPEVRGFDII